MAILTFVNLDSLIGINQSIARTLHVIDTLDDTLLLLKDAETAQLSFLLGGDEKDLEPYQAALNPQTGILPHLQDLRLLLSDNPAQLQRLDQVDPLIQTRLAQLAQTIARRRAAGVAGALPLLPIDSDQKLSNAIRESIVEIENEEGRILQVNSDSASARTQTVTILLITGVVAAFAFLAHSFFSVNRQAVDRARAEEDLRVMNRELDLRVAERTAELAQSKGRIEQQLTRMSVLRALDSTILGTTDLRVIFRAVLDEVRHNLRVDVAEIMLYNPHTLSLELADQYGIQNLPTRLKLGEGLMGRAALERRVLSYFDLDQSAPADLPDALVRENIRAVVMMPLIAKGALIGVFAIGHRTPLHPDQEWIGFLETFAGQVAMAISGVQSFEDLQRSNMELALAYDTTIEGWSHALDLRDRETEGHTQRVTETTLTLAHMAGIEDAQLVHVKRGALLHDIGKMGIPDSILLKPDKLTPEEWEIMRQHPTVAFQLLRPIRHLQAALDIPYCHHEKWDGTGYPRHLAGEQIPLAARLFSVVDVWDALRSDRPYRRGWTEAATIQYLYEHVNTQFEPRAVELFMQMRRERGAIT